ncbi:MAG: MATE family efflux transporter [Clostridiaceae bacterium]|nr:MATE family efflux transporter [Clostridiaceae bacterium]
MKAINKRNKQKKEAQQEEERGRSMRLNMKTENKMAVMPVPKLLFNMSIPLMFFLLIQSLYNIVDGIFVAKLSENALTATSLVYPLQVVMITVSVGTAIGVNAELSRLLGEKKIQDVTKVAVTGLILTAASSLVFVLAGALFADQIASALSKDAEIRQLCSQYLRICMVFGSGIFIEMMFQRFLQATGKTFLSMVSLVVGAVTNIVLDPILIFGYFGFPALGIQGAAAATVIGQWIGSIVACLLNTFLNREVKIVFRDYRMTKSAVAKIYLIGAPTMITNGMPSVMVAVMNVILMPFSPSAVAFFGVYYKLQNFLLMPINGMGQACLPIISYNYGTRNFDRIKKVFRYSIPAAVIISLIATILFLAVPQALLGLFSAGEEMLSIGIPGLRIISVTFAFASVTVILGYAASGLGNSMILMIGTLIRQFAVLLPIAYLLAAVMGIQYVWYAFLPAEIMAFLFMVIASKRLYLKVQKKSTEYGILREDDKKRVR